MIQVSIFEQIEMFFNIFIHLQNKFILLGITFFLLLIMILASNFKNKKITKIICFLTYLSIISYLVYKYHLEILNLLDYLMDNITFLLFFPNLAVYILVLILVNFLVIKSIFSLKNKKLEKIINISFFMIFNIIFYLIVNNIIENNINVYEQLSIYTNNELLNLIGLNMKLFLIWILVILVINLINYLIVKLDNKKYANNNLTLTVPESNELDAANFINSTTSDNYNIYNDYLDIVPVKKKVYKEAVPEITNDVSHEIIKETTSDNTNDTSNIEKPVLTFSNEEVNSILDNIYNKEDNLNKNDYLDNKELANNLDLLEEEIDKDNSFLMPTLDELLNNSIKHDYKLDIQEIPELDNNKYINNETEVDLKSYDDIFSNYKSNINYQDDMDNVFTSNSNYLDNILYDVEKLRNNTCDKLQIEEVYNKIKLNHDNLSLNDYNYLINRLLEIKK